MSAAIYQRARPVHWDEVVGQEHVKEVLRPALEKGRVGHAYLFSGPRGVGKTTTARLIAMTVSCEGPVGVAKPCGACEPCRMVIAGRHPDVLEIDAASNNSVDDVRDLREKVALAPMRGSRKVYILDEAHMMSKSAFNALLKTLEEPPGHVVFVLATTEPERLPPTILSRCQHYRFRRHSVEEIAGKLGRLAADEGVTAEPAALRLVARAADGAMRDGESLLERLLAGGEPTLTAADVEGALGLPPQERVAALARDLARGDTAAVLEGLGGLYGDGFAPRTVTERAKIALRDLLHAGLGLGGETPAETFPEGKLLRLIRALDEEDARFARSSDLLALEMAFTRALLASAETGGNAASPGAPDPGLARRVAALERLVREGGVREGAHAPVLGNVADFDPLAPAPRRKPEAAASEPAAQAQEPPPRQGIGPKPEPAPSTPLLDNPRELQTTSAEQVEASVTPGPTTSLGTWDDVVKRADNRFKAILRPTTQRGGAAEVEIHDNLVVLSYKANFHAGQVAGRFQEVVSLVRSVFGEDFSLELRLPDGTKKNSRGAAPSPQPPVPAPRPAPTAPESAATPTEPPRAPEPRPERSPPAPVEAGGATGATAFDFERLGEDEAAPLLPLEVLTPPEPEPPSPLEVPDPEGALEAEIEPRLEHGPGLETVSLALLEEAPPLAAFDGDLFDEAVLEKASAPAEVQGHPNYAALARLFPHKVREAGRLAAGSEAAAAEEVETA